MTRVFCGQSGNRELEDRRPRAGPACYLDVSGGVEEAGGNCGYGGWSSWSGGRSSGANLGQDLSVPSAQVAACTGRTPSCHEPRVSTFLVEAGRTTKPTVARGGPALEQQAMLIPKRGHHAHKTHRSAWWVLWVLWPTPPSPAGGGSRRTSRRDGRPSSHPPCRSGCSASARAGPGSA